MTQVEQDEVFERSVGDHVRAVSGRTPEERSADLARATRLAQGEEADFAVIHSQDAPSEK
jgi:hypothetical protein